MDDLWRFRDFISELKGIRSFFSIYQVIPKSDLVITMLGNYLNVAIHQEKFLKAYFMEISSPAKNDGRLCAKQSWTFFIGIVLFTVYALLSTLYSARRTIYEYSTCMENWLTLVMWCNSRILQRFLKATIF